MDVFALFFSLQGRISRAKYWLGVCVTIPLVLLQFFIDPPFAKVHDLTPTLVALAIAVLNLWISVCVAGKRYHDRGKSAWWFLIVFIPIVGAIWQFIELGLLRGDEGSNDYGPDPLNGSNVAGDIETMRQQAAASVGATQPVAAAMPRRRAPYNDGRAVFGKRI
jgi:uncharacterized membrane protein YhaH (DUF805 family)